VEHIKNVKNVEKRDMNKKRKKTFITSMVKNTRVVHYPTGIYPRQAYLCRCRRRRLDLFDKSTVAWPPNARRAGRIANWWRRRRRRLRHLSL